MLITVRRQRFLVKPNNLLMNMIEHVASLNYWEIKKSPIWDAHENLKMIVYYLNILQKINHLLIDMGRII